MKTCETCPKRSTCKALCKAVERTLPDEPSAFGLQMKSSDVGYIGALQALRGLSWTESMMDDAPATGLTRSQRMLFDRHVRKLPLPEMAKIHCTKVRTLKTRLLRLRADFMSPTTNNR
jgi:transposase